MNTQIKMHVQKLEKTKKGTFKVIEEETETIDQKQYNNITCDDTLQFFKRLGGTESITYGNTSRGSKVIKLVSTYPNKELRIIRTFDFK